MALLMITTGVIVSTV